MSSRIKERTPWSMYVVTTFFDLIFDWYNLSPAQGTGTYWL